MASEQPDFVVCASQANMPSPVQGVVFGILAAASVGLAVLVGQRDPALGVVTGAAGVVIAILVACAIKVANQWERGVVLRLGRLRGVRGPGLFFIVPVLDRIRMLDMRVLTYHIRKQEAITRDNVPVTLDSVLFYRVTSAEDAVMKIQDYAFGIAQLAQSALRDVVGGMTLDELLAEREQIARQVAQHVETDSREWGLDVTGIRLQDIDMPEELEEDHVSPGRRGAGEAGHDHQSGGRQAGRGKPGGGGGHYGRQPRRHAVADIANHRRPRSQCLEHRTPGRPP